LKFAADRAGKRKSLAFQCAGRVRLPSSPKSPVLFLPAKPRLAPRRLRNRRDTGAWNIPNKARTPKGARMRRPAGSLEPKPLERNGESAHECPSRFSCVRLQSESEKNSSEGHP